MFNIENRFLKQMETSKATYFVPNCVFLYEFKIQFYLDRAELFQFFYSNHRRVCICG